MKAPMMVPVSCLPGVDRDDPAQLPPASGGESLSDLRLGKARQLSR